MTEVWPPTTKSPYDDPGMAEIKPGNFFTLASKNHPAYDLYRALAEQEWTYDISSSRHWVTMTKGDRYISFSLFGQGAFGGRNEHGDYGVGLEDYDNVWSEALPHIAVFMRTLSDDHAEMMSALMPRWLNVLRLQLPNCERPEGRSSPPALCVRPEHTETVAPMARGRVSRSGDSG